MQHHFVKGLDNHSHISVSVLLDIKADVQGSYVSWDNREVTETIEATVLQALQKDGFKQVELSRYGIETGKLGRSRVLHEISLATGRIRELDRLVRNLKLDQTPIDDVAFQSFIPDQIRKLKETIEEVEARFGNLKQVKPVAP